MKLSLLAVFAVLVAQPVYADSILKRSVNCPGLYGVCNRSLLGTITQKSNNWFGSRANHTGSFALTKLAYFTGRKLGYTSFRYR